MNEIDEIKAALSRVRFANFRDYATAILRSFRIPNATTERLLSKAALESFKHPILVYRRAIIIHRPDLTKHIDLPRIRREVDGNVRSAYRLLVVIGDGVVACEDSATGLAIEFEPDRISEYVQFFFPLIYGTENQKDLDVTVEFSELIGKLFTQLCLDDQNSYADNPRKLTNFILDLISIAFASSILKNNELQQTLAWAKTSSDTDYQVVISSIFDAILRDRHHGDSYRNLPHWEICSAESGGLPHINRESFKLAAQILCYDLATLDGEILGSLIYKLVQKDNEQSVYGHPTSYRLVAKALSPLFVNEYAKEIENSRGDSRRLKQLRNQLLTLRIFDPTNGPGCFLTAAFNSVIDLVYSIDAQLGDRVNPAKVRIENFVGLVHNEISQGLSRLSLWTAYLQYLQKNGEIKDDDLAVTYKQIRVSAGDPLTIDWENVCPNEGKTLIIGSPTFKGKNKFTPDDRRRMAQVFGSNKLGDADFCSCWLYLAAEYIRGTHSKCALVLTNSVCQGSQVFSIWSKIYSLDCEIAFAHRSFKVQVGSQLATGITVIVVGLSSPCNEDSIKYLYAGDGEIETNCIGPYLVDSTKTIIESQSKPLSRHFPPMPRGNMPYDHGHLLLTPDEKKMLLRSHPDAIVFLRKIVGSKEFIDHMERWCLWISDEQRSEAVKIRPISDRVEKVRRWRLANSDRAVQRMALRPHQFRDIRPPTRQTLVIPAVSSENRPYIPIGFIGEDTVVSNLAFAIYDCPSWMFGVLSSRMHMAWIRTVCGALETRPRYSNTLGYNTFFFPAIPESKQKEINLLVMDIIGAREEYFDRPLGQLYSALPHRLEILHGYLDDSIDRCYQDQPFGSDIERVKLLFQLYGEQRS
jgi:hypothetical protein